MIRLRKLGTLAILGFLLLPAPHRAEEPHPSGATGSAWLLAFKGKSMNQLVWDKRFTDLLKARLPRTAAKFWANGKQPLWETAINHLGGPPSDVEVVDDRYVVSSACVAHFCDAKGVIWIDVQTTAIVFGAAEWIQSSGVGADERHHLWLISNVDFESAKLPPSLVAYLEQWSAHANLGAALRVAEVTYVSPSGRETKLKPADVHVVH